MLTSHRGSERTREEVRKGDGLGGPNGRRERAREGGQGWHNRPVHFPYLEIYRAHKHIKGNVSGRSGAATNPFIRKETNITWIFPRSEGRVINDHRLGLTMMTS